MKPLSELLTPATLAPLFAAFYDASDGYETYRKKAREIVWPAIRGHLEGLQAAGKLAPIPNSKGRSTNFLDAWNVMATGEGSGYSKPEYMWNDILQPVCHPILFNALDELRETAKQLGSMTDAEKNACDRLIAAIETGFIRRYEAGDHECRNTGDRLSLEIKGWQPHFLLYKAGKFVPMEEVPEFGIVELDVELKTGNLLIADWFRIDAFTKSVKLKKEPSINSVLGCQEFTQRSLAEHGFMTVFVGNSSPRIVRMNGALVLGWYDEDGDEEIAGEKAGWVCTDLWWATIIERERLVSIVARTHGEEEAESMVAAYLADTMNSVSQVKVAPGKHKLYCAGDRAIMEEGFAAKDFPLGPMEPYLVLADRRLELVERPPSIAIAQIPETSHAPSM